MSTPVRGGPQGPLGYAPRRTREAGAAGTSSDDPAQVDGGDAENRATPSLRDALRDHLPPREMPSLREALASPDTVADSLSGLAAPRQGPAAGDPAPMRDALSALERLTSRSAQLLREPSASREPRLPVEPAPVRRGLERSPERSPDRSPERAPLIRDSLRETLQPLAMRDPLPTRDPPPPRGGRMRAPAVDDDAPPIPTAMPRDLLDGGLNFELPPVAPRARRGDDRRSDDTRRRASADAFAGDQALVALRNRMSGELEDDFEPRPAKRSSASTATRVAGVVALAAGGAFGFLWINGPHHRAAPAASKEEVTLLDLKGAAPAAAAPQPPAATVVPPARPNPARPPVAVASYTNEATNRAVAPPVMTPRVVTVTPAPPVIAPPPPAPVPAPVAVVTPPSTTPPVSDMLSRAGDLLSHGDVAAARLLLRRAAQRDSAQAALELAGTYDATVLRRIGSFSDADPAQAREWYRKAAQLGSADAAERLRQLDDGR